MAGLGSLAAGACGGEIVAGRDPLPMVRPPPPMEPLGAHPAVGPLDTLGEAQRRLYLPSDAFTELGPPREYSWRARVPEPGQSYPEFAVSAPNLPREPRRRLYLLPLGTFPNDLVVESGYVVLVRSPPLTWLADFLERFYGLRVTVMDRLELDDLEIPSRERHGHEQVDARALLTALAGRIPNDAYSMTALINRDLYAFGNQRYAFGYGLHRDRMAVMSFARFDPVFVGQGRPDSWVRDIERRSLVVLAHEVGHTFGMRHCTYYECVMNGMSHPKEVDATPLHLCPVCLRKWVSLVSLDPRSRYEQLQAFYRASEMVEPAGWIEQRLAHTRPLSAASI